MNRALVGTEQMKRDYDGMGYGTGKYKTEQGKKSNRETGKEPLSAGPAQSRITLEWGIYRPKRDWERTTSGNRAKNFRGP